MNIKMKSLLKEGMNPKDKIELSKIRGIYSSIQDSYIEGIKKMNAEKDPKREQFIREYLRIIKQIEQMLVTADDKLISGK